VITATPPLTPIELLEALEALDIEQKELARLLDVGIASVHRWVGKDGTVPGCACLLVRLLIERPELKAALGVQPSSGRGRPIKARRGARSQL
jgi:DNA-binding transcriptional regulator YiaG